jgi:hypothetical protein
MCWRVDGKYMSEFATYQQFFSAEEAEGVIAILKEHGIPYTFKQTRAGFDTVIIGENLNEQWDLRIPTDQFSRANDLLLANTTVNLEELEKDYYLFSFSQEELENIIRNPDEWGRHDYLVAVELLKQRGENVSKEQLQEFREKKMEVLAKPPKKVPLFWLIAAYGLPVLAILLIWTPAYYDSFNDSTSSGILLVYIGAYVIAYGGVIAVLVGLSLWQFKKMLPDGNRVYRFLPGDRKHGKTIFFLGLIAAFSLVISSFYNSNTGNLLHEIFG